MPDSRTSILVVDDHVVVRKGLIALLTSSDQYRVIGEAGTLEEARSTARACKPDLVMMDQKLPDGDGIDLCADLKREFPLTRIIILTAYQSRDLVERAMQAGADGVLLKTIDGLGILDAVDGVMIGRCSIDPMLVPSMALSLRDGKHGSHVPDTDADLLSLLAKGRTNKEIAAELGLAEKTVRNRLSILYRRLGVGNRTEAALLEIGTFIPPLRDK